MLTGDDGGQAEGIRVTDWRQRLVRGRLVKILS